MAGVRSDKVNFKHPVLRGGREAVIDKINRTVIIEVNIAVISERIKQKILIREKQ